MRQEFPGKDIPRLPAKNRSSSTGPGTISPESKDNGGESSDAVSRASSESTPTTSSPILSLSIPSVQHRSRSTSDLPQAAGHGHHLPREKNRLTLRAFLRQIIRDRRLVRSKTFVRFLLSEPIPKLSENEEIDIERRLEMDRLRLAEQEQFVEESRKRASELDQWLRGFKKDLVRNRICPSIVALIAEGLTKLFEEIRAKDDIRDLLPEYQKVAEWAKIEYFIWLSVTDTELPPLFINFLLQRIILRKSLLKHGVFTDYYHIQSSRVSCDSQTP